MNIFKDGEFHYIIDKGLLDSVLVIKQFLNLVRRLLQLKLPLNDARNQQSSRYKRNLHNNFPRRWNLKIKFFRRCKITLIKNQEDYNWKIINYYLDSEKMAYKVFKPNVQPDHPQFKPEDKDNYHYIYVLEKKWIIHFTH